MSIWSSVGEPVPALDGHGEAANYRAEGEPSLAVDIATANHDHIRLAIWSEPPRAPGEPATAAVLAPAARASTDACALLSRDAALELVKKLNYAIAHSGGRTP